MGRDQVSEDASLLIDPRLAISNATGTMAQINPAARIEAVWMGDNWQGGEHIVISLNDYSSYWVKRNDPGTDSVIVFSDGHKILARTDEQSAGNPAPRLGRAGNDSGSNAARTSRKKTRHGKGH